MYKHIFQYKNCMAAHIRTQTPPHSYNYVKFNAVGVSWGLMALSAHLTEQLLQQESLYHNTEPFEMSKNNTKYDYTYKFLPPMWQVGDTDYQILHLWRPLL